MDKLMCILATLMLVVCCANTAHAMTISYGEFKTTAYCACRKCCGHSTGITASGTKVKQGRTCAVDPEYIPLGTHIMIDGHEYITEDTGVKGRTIDIYFDSHKEALKYGVKNMEVYIIEED